MAAKSEDLRQWFEIISTVREMADLIGVSPNTLYRYRRTYPSFPTLPTIRAAVFNWAAKYGLPSKRGPKPDISLQVAYLRETEGLSFSDIGLKLGISKQAAWAHWRRYKKSISASDTTAGVSSDVTKQIDEDTEDLLETTGEPLKDWDGWLTKGKGPAR